ncbi:MAG: glycosyltransferase [Flavobacteria bacterium RIFCSPLOWO2_12_FULL_35_11]|nr:MAG: glycosyltransferase [Flavobacteria bacterium RIFCSPLOWO2_12_FULL_35_11]
MKNLLIIGFVWPEPNSTAAGSRMLQLISLFQKNGFTVTFVCAASKTTNSFDLEKLNIQTFYILLNDSSFDSLIKKINPNFVLFDRFLTEEQFGWRIAENCPEAIRILDTEDLHFLRNARQVAHQNNTTVSLSDLMSDLAKREIASIYRCDLTLIISKYEMKLLKKTFNIDKSLLHYVPFILNKMNMEALDSYPSFQNRNHFITIGNFKHEPNWNSVQYLKTDIWPLIREKLPEAEMHIYGAYAKEKVQQLHNKKEGFLIKGWAENLEDVFTNTRVCLAPLRFGAGLKGKLIDAMKFGTPSVTTNIGAEAMHYKLPWNGFITDDPTEFALKAVELYSNQKIWEDAQQKGIEIINTCYSKEKYEKKLLNNIENIQKNIVEHRLQNFIGSLLMYHNLQSTKYMSKWIEEKNKPSRIHKIN